MALNNLHMVLDCTIVLGGHIAPYLIKQDIDMLFSKLQDRTAFPEEENFIRIGAQENDAVAAGAAIPFIRTFLETIWLPSYTHERNQKSLKDTEEGSAKPAFCSIFQI